MQKQQEFERSTVVVLSDKALYSFSIQLDPQTAQPMIELYSRTPILQISHVVVSPYCDNYLAIHMAQSGGAASSSSARAAGPTDVLWRIRHKTELLALLKEESAKLGRPMFDLRFQPNDNLIVNVVKNRHVDITWSSDPSLDSCTDKLVRVKHNLQILVGSGLPAMQVPVPPKPAALDTSVPGGGRPCLKALYDCAGNEAQGEIAFKTGDIIFIIKDEEGGWFEGELKGKRGFVPGTYVERVKRAVVGAKASSSSSSSGPKAGGKPMFNFTASAGPPPVNVAAPKKSAWEELKSDQGEVRCCLPLALRRALRVFRLSVVYSVLIPSFLCVVVDCALFSSQTYYYNRETQESSWDKPAELNAPAPASSPMSPVSQPVAQGCAFAGCGKPRFGGKPYCAAHAGGGAAAAPAASVVPPPVVRSSGPPPISQTGGSAAPRFGGGASATPTPVPAARPAFGGGASSTNPPPVTRTYGAGATSNPTPAARPAYGAAAATPTPAPRFGAGANGPSNTAPGPSKPAIQTGAVAANRENLFKGGQIPIFGAPRPMGTGNPNAAGMYSAPAAAQPAPVAAVQPKPAAAAAAVPPRPVYGGGSGLAPKKKSDWVAVKDER